jgi:hypothetical protein
VFVPSGGPGAEARTPFIEEELSCGSQLVAGRCYRVEHRQLS